MKTRSAVAAVLGLALPAFASEPGPAPRLDQWRVVGPGGGGTMRRPAVSPHDPRIVVEGCDMTGSYITKDGGASWRMFHLGWVIDQYAFDPSDPRVIYAASSALWRSDDAGTTWDLVFPDPAQDTAEVGLGDHADVAFTTDDPLYPSGQDAAIHAVAVDPADSRRLYIALSSNQPGPPGTHPPTTTAILASTDRGRTWTRATELAVERVFAIRVEPKGVVRVASESGAYEGSGATWRHFDHPGTQAFTSAGFGQDAASGRTLLYATSPITQEGGGLDVSEDGGRTWRGAVAGLTPLFGDAAKGEAWGGARRSRTSLGPVAVSANHGLVAYVGLRGLKQADGASFNGVARTTDGGKSWAVVNAEADRPSTNLTGSWIEERAVEDGHSVWFDAPFDIAVAPGDPDVAYATDLFRTYGTKDGGRTWQQFNSARRGPDAWTSRGLDVTSAYGVHWDPFDQKRVFISYTDIGLFRSEDGGDTWTGSSKGIPAKWRNTTYWIAFDPDVKGLVWGAFSGTHDLPRPKMWRRTDPARFQGGVGVSTDGGRTWTPSSGGMQESAITHVIFDPTSPKGQRTLYAAAYGRGVYKSTDNGRTWTLKNQGIEGAQPFAWRLTRVSDGTLYVVVARRSERGKIGDAEDGALYRSTDGALHWTRLTLPAGTNGPNGLTVDPRDSQRLYLSSWGVATPGGDTGGGIFLSTDRGATWRNVLPQSQHVYDVTVDPRDPKLLFASGFDQAAWRSNDAGETWSRLGGFNFKWGHRVIPDVADPGRIYVTTFGGSVWHGPAAGDPRSREDVGVGPRRETALPQAPRSRVEQLVEANIAAVHAFQVRLAKAAGKGDPACWAAGGLDDAALDAIEAHQTALLKTDPALVRAWIANEPSTFDPAQDLEPLLRAGLTLAPTLPVSVYTKYLLAQDIDRPRAHLRAVANLYQTVLEVERDGDRLQDLYRFYIGLGLPVYVGQFGLPGSDAQLLAVGRSLVGKTCESPVGLTAEEWQIAGRKIWNWGEKNLHRRDAKVLADELLTEADIAPLVPKMRALKSQRVAIIGHSFTMDLHWSSPSSFVPTVTAMFARENPKVEFRQFEGGGMTASRAYKNFYKDVLAWKPDLVLLVVINRTDADLAAFKRLGEGLVAAGARVYSFDDVHDPDTTDPARIKKEAELAKEAGIVTVEIGSLLAAAPGREHFFCLDKIHMTEPYHRLMAREWLKLLVGARGASLGS